MVLTIESNCTLLVDEDAGMHIRIVVASYLSIFALMRLLLIFLGL